MTFIVRAPDIVERLVDRDPAALKPLPALLPADVVKFCAIQKTRGRSAIKAARAGAVAALAAGAHAGALQASKMMIETHYRPGGRNEVIIPDKIERPMPLLPLVRYCIGEYLALRGNPRTGPLFARDDGGPIQPALLRGSLALTAKLFGMQGHEAYKRLLIFFERQLDAQPGDSLDAVAVNYMIGRYTRFENYMLVVPDPPALPDLSAILNERHALAGPADVYLEPTATFMNAEPSNLGCRVHRRRLSEAFKTDSIVLGLRAVQWPRGKAERKKLRAKLKKLHFAHLHSLWKDKLLATVEVASLLRMAQRDACIRLMRFVPFSIEHTKTGAAQRRAMVIERWHSRPDGETFAAFNTRVVDELKLQSKRIAYIYLREANLLRRRRGRPRKRKPHD
jgi:hypothetical protein